MKPRRAQRDIAFFCVAFSVVFISMLYSFDFGPFLALGTTVFCVVVISAANRNGPTARSLRRRAVLLSMAVAFGLLSSIIAVFSWADAPEIVPDLIDLLVGYRITMNQPFPAARHVLGWGICGIVSIGSIFWIHRELRSEMNRKGEFFPSIEALTLLLAATVFSAVWLGYGLTRSDRFHVKLACMPAVFSVGLLLPCYLRTRKVKYALIFGGLGLPLVIGTCYIERPENPIDRISSMLTFDLRGAEWKVTAAAIGAGIDAAQGQHTQSLFVWPYQTVVSSILGRRDPLHTVQAHMATTRRLDHRNVESLKSRHSLSALLLMDSWKIDGIPNPSRSPAVFHYLLTRFDLSEAPKHHAALLERRLAGERVFNVFSLPVPQRGESLGGGLVLDIEEYDVRATDVLWLRIRATEGTRIPLSRPGRLRILVHLSNGQIHNNPYLVRGDGESEHLLLETVSPTNDLVLSPFLPGPRRLRSMETVDRIEMTWEPLGLLSGSQPEIRFEGLEAWRVLSGSIKTVSLEAQPPNEFWSWVFADEPVKGEKGNPSADSSDGNGS
ncbi:MAG: hypothetical protein HRU16_08355 [Planctomycetes bacterium]|nr:hypothetical protein [Planctomycetota bacterium]